MARIVMKFGGTSVADLDRIRNVADRVKRQVEAGDEVAVVVSAMAGATNQLVAWCQALSPLHDAREYDAVVATGEQVTTGLLAIALQAIGVEARSWAGWQIPLRTDDSHGAARILGIDAADLIRRKQARSPSSPASRVSRLITGSQRWAAAAPIPRPLHSPPPSARNAATSTRMSTASTPPTRAWCRVPAGWRRSPTRKCWNSPPSVPRCCRPAASN